MHTELFIQEEGNPIELHIKMIWYTCSALVDQQWIGSQPLLAGAEGTLLVQGRKSILMVTDPILSATFRHLF